MTDANQVADWIVLGQAVRALKDGVHLLEALAARSTDCETIRRSQLASRLIARIAFSTLTQLYDHVAEKEPK